MKLEDRLTNVLHDMHQVITTNTPLAIEDIISLIDLTLLNEQATSEDIVALANKANRHHVAAICIYPQQVKWLPIMTSPIKTAVVVNFPSGIEPQMEVLKTIENAATLHKVDEIDYVFPYQLYLSGQKTKAMALCHDVFQQCKRYQLTLKVIIETGALPSNDVIYELSTDLIHSGCDFLKTSTGKIKQGATIPAVFSMLSAIVDSNTRCGIKISGGVKTMDQAISYLHLTQYMLNQTLHSDCFRLGSSSLLDDLLITDNKNTRATHPSI